MPDTPIPQEEFAFRKEVLERLTRMETTLAPMANGRIKSIEDDVAKIKQERSWDRGLAAGISLTVSALFTIVRAYLRVP